MEISSINFNNRSKNREHNIFTPEFYGGADANIYINDVIYDSISSVSFAMREQKKPIYSYASRVYDEIAHGSRIVQGIITVPIKNKRAFTNTRTRATNEVRYSNVNIPSWLNEANVQNTEKLTKLNEQSLKEEKSIIRIDNEKIYLDSDFKIGKVISGTFNVEAVNDEYMFISNSEALGYIKRGGI